MASLLFIDGLELDFFNPRSLLLFICLLQGAVFAALLVARYFKRRNRSDLWLAALLVLFCSSLVTPLIGFANVYDRNQWLTYFPFRIAYSYGVCVWFYVLAMTGAKRRLPPKSWLLFLPSAIYLAFRLTLFAQDLEFKNWFDETYYVPVAGPLIFVTEFGWNLIFLYLAISRYRKYRAWLDENYSDTEKIKFDWLRNFLYVFTLISILGGLFGFTDSFIFQLSYIQYFYFELILAIVTYYLALAGYLRSQTLEIVFDEAAPEPETRKNLLSEDELENLKSKLRRLMKTEKIFLDPQLTLTDLSKKLGVNSAVLSYAINRGFGVNFNDFINQFRIAEVKAKIERGEATNSNLLALAFECGFNSKATFNRAFKKFSGMSPREFQSSR